MIYTVAFLVRSINFYAFETITFFSKRNIVRKVAKKLPAIWKLKHETLMPSLTIEPRTFRLLNYRAADCAYWTCLILLSQIFGVVLMKQCYHQIFCQCIYHWSQILNERKILKNEWTSCHGNLPAWEPRVQLRREEIIENEKKHFAIGKI